MPHTGYTIKLFCLHLLIKNGRNNYFTIRIQNLQLQIHPSATLGSRNKPWTQRFAFYQLRKLMCWQTVVYQHSDIIMFPSDIHSPLSSVLLSINTWVCSCTVVFKGSEPFPIKLQTIKRWIKVEVEAISHCIPRLCRGRSHRSYSLICLEAVTCHRTPMAAVR